MLVEPALIFVNACGLCRISFNFFSCARLRYQARLFMVPYESSGSKKFHRSLNIYGFRRVLHIEGLGAESCDAAEFSRRKGAHRFVEWREG